MDMLSFQSLLRSYKYCFIVAAVIIHFTISRFNKEGYHIHHDALSALDRAKTEACRAAILQIAQNMSDRLTQVRLSRTCSYDLKGPRIYPVGCMEPLASNDLVRLDENSLTLCLDSCFSYGHSFGGYDESNRSCYCGDSYIDDLSKDNTCTNGFYWFRLDSGIYSPTMDNRRSRIKNPGAVNIAFIMTLNGRSELQIRRLLKTIYHKNHLYYIHVDERMDYLYRRLLPLNKTQDNIIVTNSRFRTLWGSPSLLHVILDAIKNIEKRRWDFLINLSESDFPLKSLNQLERYLEHNSDSIFLKAHNMKGYKFIQKQGLDRIFHQCDDHVWQLGERSLPRGIIYSGGSDWFALPRKFCDFIINEFQSEHESERNLVRTLLQLSNNTLLPVESVFHTIAMNSKFCGRFIDDNLRLTNWKRKLGCKCQHKDVVDWCGCSPMIYRPSDWPRLHKTKFSENLFFSRKFDPTISNSIINQVESRLIEHSSSLSDHSDTRYWINMYHFEENVRGIDAKAYEKMGLYALLASRLEKWVDSTLTSVDLYFNHDRFVGYVLQYCNQANCMQLLVERNDTAYLTSYNHECLGSGERKLETIEVNHGFDASEKIFRNYSPLNDQSEIVVYHEWLVKRTSNRTLKNIKFSWYGPNKKIVLVQDAKLKMSSNLTRLSLAHRLNIEKPLKAGEWTLVVSRGEQKCLAYNFLILGVLSSSQWAQFYKVSDHFCNIDRCKSEQPKEWTLYKKQELLSKYQLV